MVEQGGPGSLFVVSTPIGNMGDFSFRAVETLRAVAVVLAEDTRHSRPLLEHYEVRTPLLAYHEHNEARMSPQVVARIAGGDDVALISDAGTPLLSDPGARLVRAAVESGLRVVPVPGASALLAALVASGMDADRFTYFGFLERKGRSRGEVVAEVAALRHTAILYEAPSRVAGTLAELAAAGGGTRPAAVLRELTKLYEEVRRGTVAELAAYYGESPPRGEVVIVVAGGTAGTPTDDVLRETARALRSDGMSARDVAKALGAAGAARNLAYKLAHEGE